MTICHHHGNRHHAASLMLVWLLLVGLGSACASASPKSGETSVPRRTGSILAVFAHPDDETFAGAMLARYAREGAKVHIVVATRGEKGVTDHAGIPAGHELGRAREDELRCACRELGAAPPIVLAFGDAALGVSAGPPWQTLASLERELRTVIAEIRPLTIVTWGPDGGYGHPDHRLVSAVVTQIVQTGGDGAPSRLYYADFPADRLDRLTARPPEPYQGTDPRFLPVRVAFTEADWKANERALACHKSQFTQTELGEMSRREKEIWGGAIYLRAWFGSESADDILPR